MGVREEKAYFKQLPDNVKDALMQQYLKQQSSEKLAFLIQYCEQQKKIKEILGK